MDETPTWPPGWFPDPTGRHDHRWWDGAAWTAHVADAGVAGRDPLDGDRGGAGGAPGRPTTAPLASGATTHPDARGTEPLAVAALVIGVVGIGLALVPVLGLVAAGVALVLGLVARRRLRRGARGTSGLATAGIVLGAVGLVVATLVTITTVTLLREDDRIVTAFRDAMECLETGDEDECRRQLEADLEAILRSIG